MNQPAISEANRAAWNEAQTKRSDEMIAGTIQSLREGHEFFCPDMLNCLMKYGLTDKRIAQFGCNNGRELLSLHKYAPRECVGFDISDEFISEATYMNTELKRNCTFIRTNILDITGFQDHFDLVIITIGALTWFQDLTGFFDRVHSVLVPNGYVVIHEQHPFINMIALPTESEFDPENPGKLVNSYFKNEPWIDESGMFYTSNLVYKSKPFYSYAHSFAKIFKSIIASGLIVKNLDEFECDIGAIGGPMLNGKGLPLSYLLEAEKSR